MFVEVEVMQKPDYSQFKCGVAAKCRCIVLKVGTTSANELTILFTKLFLQQLGAIFKRDVKHV